MTKRNFEHVGGIRYDIYRPKKKSFWDSVSDVISEVIGGAIAVVIVLGLIVAIFG